MKILKLFSLYIGCVFILSSGMFLFTMTIFKILGAEWGIYNPIGNPFAVVIPVICALCLLIPRIGFNWEYLDE